MLIWKTIPKDEPVDGTTVWVRLNYWFGPPFLATFDKASTTFTSTDSPIFIYPFWTISRWADQ